MESNIFQEALVEIMGLIFHIFLATQLVLSREAFLCEDWEYEFKGECCPICSTGSRVLEHCTDSVTLNTVCAPCTEGTYMDHPNGLTKCFRCQVCDEEAHLIVKEECTYVKNTVCVCKPGYFCTKFIENSCELCKGHTVSPPGYKVIRTGTATSDTNFVACPARTFSTTNMSSSCQHWTNCSKAGMIEAQTGTSTSDVVCEHRIPSNSTIVWILPIVLILLVPTVLFIVIMRRRRRKHTVEGPAGEKKEEQKEDYLPVPETGYHMIPMEETQNPGQPKS